MAKNAGFMPDTFEINYSGVGPVSENDDGQPAGELSLFDLRILFPGKVTISGPGSAALIVEDAPLLGLLMDLTDLWRDIAKGNPSADTFDFYGEHHLELHVQDGLATLKDEFQEGRIEAPLDVFAGEVIRWQRELFSEMERVHPSLLKSSEYKRLRGIVEQAWGEPG